MAYYKIFLDEGVEYIKVGDVRTHRIYIHDYGHEYAFTIRNKNEESLSVGENSTKEEFNRAIERIIQVCKGVME